VTKVPVPFLNKGQSHTPEQDAAELKRNKDWDPNAPLSGKNSARSAATASSAAMATASSTQTASVNPAAAAADAARSAASAAKAAKAANGPADTHPASGDPLGDLARSRAAASSPVGSADPFSYFVQAGAYRTPEDAESQRAKLSLMGVEAKVSEREQSGRTVYRVRVGPFDKKDEADKAKEKLESGGLETALVRVQR
jgi:cell division protein FtsN